MPFLHSKGNIFPADNKAGIPCKSHWSPSTTAGDAEAHRWVSCMKGLRPCRQISEGCWRVGSGYCAGMAATGLKDCRGSVSQYEKHGIWVLGARDEDRVRRRDRQLNGWRLVQECERTTSHLQSAHYMSQVAGYSRKRR